MRSVIVWFQLAWESWGRNWQLALASHQRLAACPVRSLWGTRWGRAWTSPLYGKMPKCRQNSISRGDWAREQSTATTLVPGVKRMGSPIPAHERRGSHPSTDALLGGVLFCSGYTCPPRQNFINASCAMRHLIKTICPQHNAITMRGAGRIWSKSPAVP